MQTEVLVVDDNLPAAREYASLISVSTGLGAAATSSPEEAIELISSHPIKVVVLDQKMPACEGTNLYKRLKLVNGRLKVMMLTGEAAAHEVAEAFGLGYSDYLSKQRIRELGEHVHLLYLKHEVERMHESELKAHVLLHSEKVGIWPFQRSIEYYFIGVATLDEAFVFDDSWRTVKQLNAGETVRITESVELETAYRYEASKESSDTVSLGAEFYKIASLTAKLESALSEKTSDSLSNTSRKGIEVVREFKLPEVPASPLDLHVASRHFQRAPVYRKLRANILRRCGACGGDQLFPVVLYQPAGKVATRHLDYLSDGSKVILPTGIEAY